MTSDGAAAVSKGGLRATGGLTVQAGSMVVTAGGSSVAGVMQVLLEVDVCDTLVTLDGGTQPCAYFCASVLAHCYA